MSPRRTMAALLLLLQIVACSIWEPSKLAPEEAVQGRSKVRVNRETVLNPSVRNDSLVGSVADTIWAVPLSSVDRILTEEATPSQIALGVGFIGLFAVSSILAAHIEARSYCDWDVPITVTFWSQGTYARVR